MSRSYQSLKIVLQNQISEAKENEKLLILYPDLNGPVNPDISGGSFLFNFCIPFERAENFFGEIVLLSFQNQGRETLQWTWKIK